MTNAISRIDSTQVRARLDRFGLDGTFTNEGTCVRGTLGTCTQDELAF